MMVLLYLLQPETAVSIDRSIEMIHSGSAKGLMIIYYQYGAWAFLFAGLTHVIQILGLIFHNDSVSEACYGLFHLISAKGILVFSGLIAVALAYETGRTLAYLLSRVPAMRIPYDKGHIKSKPIELGLMMLAVAASAFGPGLIGLTFYGFGFIQADYKKIMLASLLGLMIFS